MPSLLHLTKKYAFIFCLLTACQSNKTPEGILPKDIFQALLKEAHLLEAKIAILHLPADSNQIYAQAWQKQLYSNYKTTPEQFQKSYDYYMQHVEDMDVIYTEMVDSLSAQEKK